MENPPKHLLSVKYLFYDNHSDGRDKYYKIRMVEMIQKKYVKIVSNFFMSKVCIKNT